MKYLILKNTLSVLLNDNIIPLVNNSISNLKIAFNTLTISNALTDRLVTLNTLNLIYKSSINTEPLHPIIG